MSQTEKVALVTGAAARIGAATCDALHKAGYFVIVHYRSSREPAAALVKRLNENRTNSSVLIQADLCDMQAVEKLAKETLEVKGRLDVLINNASSFYPTPMGTATQEHWDDLFGSNARAPFFLSQALAPELAKQKGCIVNLVDIYAERPKPKHPVYVMAKAANAMMVKTLALELAPDIRVNGVAPGAALWPAGAEHTTDKQEILKRIPMGRPAGAEQIVNAIMFMVDGNDYVTGQILAVDGGRSVQQ